MNNKKNKIRNIAIILIIIFGMVLLSLVFVNAQNQKLEDYEIIAGSSQEADFYEILSTPSSNLGALISKYEIENKLFLSFENQDLWKSSQIEEVQDFNLFLVEPDTIINFQALQDLGLFEQSELVSVRGTTDHVFETYNMMYEIIGADVQALFSSSVAFQPIQFVEGAKSCSIFFGSSVSFPANIGYRFSTETAGTLVTGTLCDSSCPTSQEIFDLYGLTFDNMYYAYFGSGGYNSKMIYMVDSSETLQENQLKYIVDLNNDGVFDLVSSQDFLKQTTSFEGNSVIFSEPNFYDIWIEII